MSVSHILSLQYSDLNTRLEARCRAIGLAYHCLPTFKINWLPWQQNYPEALLQPQDWLIFLSPNAVKGFFNEGPIKFPTRSHLIAIGSGTQSALIHHTDLPILIPSIASSEGILTLPPLQIIAQQTITLIKGTGGRELLQTELSQRGAIVHELLCYQRIPQSINLACLVKIWQNDQQPLLLATNNEALNALIEALPPAVLTWVLQKPLVVSSERLYHQAMNMGFKCIKHVKQVSETELFNAIVATKDHS